MLKSAFIQIAGDYANSKKTALELWLEIEKHYASSKKHYHNLQHLENLFIELKEHQAIIDDWGVIILSTCYHDIIYDVLKNDNEEKSAEFAVKKLTYINCPFHKIERCKAQILATKSHTISGDSDTNLFTDADLSVLGTSPEVYKTYSGHIRKEYNVYPDVIYKPGRKKVLQHFLQMERIFKTTPFFNKYEAQARLNMTNELAEYS